MNKKDETDQKIEKLQNMNLKLMSKMQELNLALEGSMDQQPISKKAPRTPPQSRPCRFCNCKDPNRLHPPIPWVGRFGYLDVLDLEFGRPILMVRKIQNGGPGGGGWGPLKLTFWVPNGSSERLQKQICSIGVFGPRPFSLHNDLFWGATPTPGCLSFDIF